MRIEEVKEFFDKQPWEVAESCANMAPHEYIDMDLRDGDYEAYIAVVGYILDNGITLYFWNHPYRSIFLGGKFYWVVNRGEEEPYYFIFRGNLDEYTISISLKGAETLHEAEKSEEAEKDVLLHSENACWDMIEFGGWESTSFTLFTNGKLRIKIMYAIPVYDGVIQVDEKDFSEIKAAIGSIAGNPPKERVDACDGEAWSFIFYDDDGNQIYKRKLAYTYDIEPFEILQNRLISYIPDTYEELKYKITPSFVGDLHEDDFE